MPVSLPGVTIYDANGAPIIAAASGALNIAVTAPSMFPISAGTGTGWTYFNLTTGGAPFQVKAGPGTFGGLITTGAVQVTAFTAYDSLSQSGILLYSNAALPATAFVPFPALGVAFTLGLNVQIATSIVGTIIVLFK